MRQWKTNPRDDTSALPPGRRLLTIRETAEMLGCTAANVYALRASGQLPFVPIGIRKGFRIDILDVEAFIDGRKEQRVAAPPKVPRPRLKHIRLP